MALRKTTTFRSLAAAVWAVLIAGTALAQEPIYVTRSGSPAPTGSASAPYHVVEAGVLATDGMPANTVQIAAANYYETFTTDVPCTLTAHGGTTTIGRLNYAASTTLEIITLNTHLFGDVVGPSWRDYERADDIADAFGGPNLWPDVVGFQEIWDEDLFFGGDGANGIHPRSGYPYGDHGDDTFGHFLNSGLALMSIHPLIDFAQFEWDDCSEFFECRAAKGWVQARFVKDGFPIGVFNLHTEAGEFILSVMTREQQIIQVTNAVNAFRVAYPDHAIFVMGDFNVYGESGEYDNGLVPILGVTVGAYDADRNAPGFRVGAFESMTYCDCNPLATYFDGDAATGRLDYIFYLSSYDSSVDVIPMSAQVLQFKGRTLTDDGLTTNQSSDHWAVHGKFRLVRP